MDADRSAVPAEDGFRVTDDPFLDEILEQPAALRRAADAIGGQSDVLQRIAQVGSKGPIVLTGMGSSLDACMCAASVLSAAGVLATVADASELLHVGQPALRSGMLVIVSQSGGSVEPLRLATAVRAKRYRPGLVAVTNGRSNELAAACDATIDTAAGPERGPSSKSFACSLVALAAVAGALTPTQNAFGMTRPGDGRVAATRAAEAARSTAAAIEALLVDHAGVAERMRSWLGDRPSLIVVGRGSAIAAAETGALLIKESAAYPAEALGTADFRHGPLELAGPRLGVVLVSLDERTDELDRALARDLIDQGTMVLVVGHGGVAPAGADEIVVPPLDPALAPAAGVVPLQLLAWRLGRERGRRPAEFIRSAKVTTHE